MLTFDSGSLLDGTAVQCVADKASKRKAQMSSRTLILTQKLPKQAEGYVSEASDEPRTILDDIRILTTATFSFFFFIFIRRDRSRYQVG